MGPSQCRLDSTTLDLSGETTLGRSGGQYYYERTAGASTAAPCSDTSPINSACPGAAPGQVVPRSCGAACANVSTQYSSLPDTLSLVPTHPLCTALSHISRGRVLPPPAHGWSEQVFMPWWDRCGADPDVAALDSSNAGALTNFARRCGKSYTGGGH